MKRKIIIKRNPNGDTRTATDTSYKAFAKANRQHIKDVQALMRDMGYAIQGRGYLHDFTKIRDEKQFYSDYLNTIENGADFTKSKWYQRHIKEERHHLLANCPEDVNLIDVIEMLCDCVAAGLARSGEVRRVEIPNAILQKAVENTTAILKDMVEIEDS